MRILGIAVLLLALALPSAAQEKKAPASGQVTLDGYLMDVHCAGGVAKKGGDVMQKAAAHTKDCATMEACAASGYGVYSGGKFYKFDKAGNEQAQKYLDKTSREDNLYVEVKGNRKGNAVNVASITEKDAPAKDTSR